MSVSEVLLQNLIPKNFLDSDDEIETWVNQADPSTPNGLNGNLQSSKQDETDFRVFQDYFGLSNLLQNIKMSEDNPLLYEGYRKPLFSKVRRFSWESDASDPSAVISPTMPNMPYCLGSALDFGLPDSTLGRPVENGFKQLPPPSLRLSKAMRDQIINGAYQQQLMQSQRQDKVLSGPPSPLQGTPVPTSAVRPQSSVQVCVFCRNNGESEAVYSSHVLKDAEGRTSCPILRAYTCPICKANGDNSHTIKYCPLNQHSASRNIPQPPTSLQNGLRNRAVRPPPVSARMNLKAR